MENENLLPEEEETSILTLTDENGEDINFEYLDCIEYQGDEYLFLLPAEDESNEIVILRVEPVDEENENYLAVEDEATLEAVFAIFKEKFRDVLEFEDCAKSTVGCLRRPTSFSFLLRPASPECGISPEPPLRQASCPGIPPRGWALNSAPAPGQGRCPSHPEP